VLIEHGAAKVYAGARGPATMTDSDLIPVRIDVTDADRPPGRKRCDRIDQ